MQRFIEWLKAFLRFVLNVEKRAPSDEFSGPGLSERADYERCRSIFNASEKKLFHELVRALPNTCFVLSKVRMEDVVRPTRDQHPAVHRAARSRVKSRHFDFVVIDSGGDPLLAIELDGPEHARHRSREADRFKDEVCERVGLRLIRVPVGYRESRLTQAVREAILPPY